MKMAAALFFMIPGPKMMWQFGELGYDVSINSNGRTGTKPLFWNYLQDKDRVKLLGVYQHFNNLRLSKSIFQTTDFKMDVANVVKQINLIEGNNQAILLANSGPETQTVMFTFPIAGKWYDYFSGQSFDITNKTVPVNLLSGEFHLFVNEAWNNKNLNLVPWDAPNFQVLGAAKERGLSMNIYPNPSKGIVHVTWEADNQLEVDFKVMDYAGREILIKKLPQNPNSLNEFEFSKMNHLNSGTYFIQMGNEVRKLIVE
jgi:hypothetical protein